MALTQDMMESLLAYSHAPSMERRCLFVVAVRTDPRDLREFRDAFRQIDRNDDGRVSRMDLADALRLAGNRFGVYVDADDLFLAADMDHAGVLNFTKFVACCLHKRLAPLDAWLAQQAFESLDRDNAGVLRAQQVRPLFGELPEGLPRSRAFTLEEWTSCVLGNGVVVETTGRTPVSCGRGNGVLGFFGLFSGCQTKKDDSVIDHVNSAAPTHWNESRGRNHWNGEEEVVAMHPNFSLLPPPPHSIGSSPDSSPGQTPRTALPPPPPPPPYRDDLYSRRSAQQEYHGSGCREQYHGFESARVGFSSPSYVPMAAM